MIEWPDLPIMKILGSRAGSHLQSQRPQICMTSFALILGLYAHLRLHTKCAGRYKTLISGHFTTKPGLYTAIKASKYHAQVEFFTYFKGLGRPDPPNLRMLWSASQLSRFFPTRLFIFTVRKKAGGVPTRSIFLNRDLPSLKFMLGFPNAKSGRRSTVSVRDFLVPPLPPTPRTRSNNRGLSEADFARPGASGDIENCTVRWLKACLHHCNVIILNNLRRQSHEKTCH